MKKFLAVLVAAITLGVAAPASADAYLHVAEAESTAIAWVRYDVCDGWTCVRVYRESYSRYSDSRVDFNIAVDRASGYHCERKVIVRGSDASRYAAYANDGLGWSCWNPPG